MLFYIFRTNFTRDIDRYNNPNETTQVHRRKPTVGCGVPAMTQTLSKQRPTLNLNFRTGHDCYHKFYHLFEFSIKDNANDIKPMNGLCTFRKLCRTCL